MSESRRKKTSGPTKPQAEREGVRVDLRLPQMLIDALDAARGDETRTKWIRDAILFAIMHRRA